MKAQHAASSGTSIFPQHSLRESATQIELMNAQSSTGGMTAYRNQTPTRVRTMLNGDEKRFWRAQPTMPVVRTGGGRSGWVPGAWRAGALVSFMMRGGPGPDRGEVPFSPAR